MEPTTPQDSSPQVSTQPLANISKNSKLLTLTIIGLLVLLPIVGIGGYYMGTKASPNSTNTDLNPTPTNDPNNQVACTMDAKLCPDGSSVGRIGPNCEFASCPTQNIQQNLQTITNVKGGYSLKIPSTWKVTTKNDDDSLLRGQDYVVNLTLSSEKGEPDGQAQFVNAITIPFPYTVKGPHYDMGKKFENGLEGLVVNNPNPVNAKSITSKHLTVNTMKALAITTIMADKNSDLSENFAGEYLFGSTTKVIYIDMGNGKILEMSGTWTQDYPQFEAIFDQIVQTLTVK